MRAEPLEARVLMSTVTWVNASGGDWNTASNWSGGQVPTASDDAVINVSGNPSITFSSGTDSVNSITSNSPLTISGGKLTVASTVQVNNTFTLNGGTLAGATVQAGSGGQGLTVGTSSSSVLDGDTVDADISLSAYSFLGVKDGLTLNGTATFGGSYSIVDFQNTQTISSGTFDFASGGSGYSLAVEGGATVTLASGVTVEGGNGNIGEVYNIGSGHTLINQGTISANLSGQTLTIGSSYALTFTNQGVVQAVGGGKLTARAAAGASSSGTLSADGSASSLTLNGPWNALGTLSATNAGTINFDGTFNNAGNTISLAATGGNFLLNGGAIVGGTLDIASGAAFSESNSSANLLDGVTVGGTLNIPSYGYLGIKDGLTVTGTVALASAAVLDFQNTQTLVGGTIQLPASGGSGYMDGEAGANITLASGTTISGGVGTIGGDYSGGAAPTFVNQGTISAGAAGANIDLAGTWQSLGTLSSANGGVIRLSTSYNNANQTTTVGGSLTLDGGAITGGTLDLSGGGTLSADGNSANLLDGVTLNGNLSLTVAAAFLGIKDGLTLNGTASIGGWGPGFPVLDFENSGTLGGNANVQFTNGYGNLDIESGSTVTLASSVTVHGGNATIGNAVTGSAARTIINQGAISADVASETMTVGGSGLTFVNQGTAQATAGALQLNSTNDATITMSNTGSFAASGTGASVAVGGTWSSGSLGTLNASSGGVIDLSGVYNNASNTIGLNGSGGSYALNSATVNNGTINIASGDTLSVTSASFSGGLTVNGNLNLTASAARLGILGGLTFNGTATIGGQNSPGFDFQNSGSLAGTATLVCGF